VEKVIERFCSTAVPSWMGHIEDFHLECFWANRLSAVFPVGLHQFGISPTKLGILFDGVDEQISLPLHHLSHTHDLELPDRLRLTGVVAQDVAQVVA
jgi:hypothetical protein